MSDRLADVILGTHSIRESSFDCERARDLAMLYRETITPEKLVSCYKLTIKQAALLACIDLDIDSLLVQPVCLLMSSSYKEALAWAEEASRVEVHS
jgi:hypothetical protein